MKDKLLFAAIDPYGIVEFKDPKEDYLDKEKKVMSWGIKNDYPDYLLSLYNDVGILRTVINGCIDYTLGNGLRVEGTESEQVEELAPKLIRDFWIYGGFAFQIIRNKLKEPSKFVYLDFRNVRCSEDHKVFYYSEDWSKSWGRCKYITYPAYDPNDEDQATGIIYVKNVFNQTYPTPVYGAKTTIQACEIEKEITSYHYSSIRNGFTGGYLFDFHSGTPTDDEKKEIEKNIIEKYTGTGNAGRPVLNFSDDREHGLELTKLETDDFDKKYEALTEKSQQEIFTSFRATPNLFGISSKNNGFNSEEYESTFKLFNRTMIKPAQNILIRTFDKLGISMTITPFSWE